MKRINLLKETILLMFAIIAFASCKTEQNKTETERQKYVIPDSLAKTLTIDSVGISPLMSAVNFTGKVTFNEDHVVKVYPLVSGNVQDVKVMLGDYVQAGQVLAVIKSTEMAGYSSDLVNAQTNLSLAKKNLDAQQDLFKSGLASQLDVLNAQTNYEQAKAQLAKTTKVLKINGANTQGDYVVKAPISGFIVEKFITNNTAIRADNGNNIFTISDLQNVWVIANVYESNISLVHQGDAADITTLSYPGKVFHGKVDKIMNVLDPTNKVMKVRIMLSNPGYVLKPEMFTNITITNKENKPTLCVPSKAIVFDHSENYVLVYKNNADVRITPVSVLNIVGDKTYLAGGVKPGDKVIGSQAILIYDALNN
ncbi:MAG: efflux RND transporter periplasmic adaptor subunit [Bacteroidota bacterium]|nr:efflux RND transporter periplasmic adaptor subunit [Bacteroidota bacterium]